MVARGFQVADTLRPIGILGIELGGRLVFLERRFLVSGLGQKSRERGILAQRLSLVLDALAGGAVFG